MSDPVPVSPAPPSAVPKKKGKGNAAKKPKAAPSHPKVSEMVTSAITSLKERGGSSLQAIKKHIAAHHKVDVDRLSPFIKKYLKSAVASGALVQTKGKGATGSFKLSGTQKGKESSTASTKPKAKKAPAKKEGGSSGAAKKTAKTAAAKKAARPKAKAAEKKKSAPKKPAAKKVTKPKTPKKSPKATKPKSPKPKKAKTPKKTPAAKKASKK